MAAKKMKKKSVTKKTTTKKAIVKKIVKKTVKEEKLADKKIVVAEGTEKAEEVSEEELNNFFDDEYPEESDYDSLPKEENKPFQKGFEEE